MTEPINTYVSIGNSDGKLSQDEWHEFCESVNFSISAASKIVHGRWFSLSNAPFQNACWCAEVNDRAKLEAALRLYARTYRQEAIMWCDGTPRMLGPSEGIPSFADGLRWAREQDRKAHG